MHEVEKVARTCMNYSALIVALSALRKIELIAIGGEVQLTNSGRLTQEVAPAEHKAFQSWCIFLSPKSPSQTRTQTCNLWTWSTSSWWTHLRDKLFQNKMLRWEQQFAEMLPNRYCIFRAILSSCVQSPLSFPCDGSDCLKKLVVKAATICLRHAGPIEGQTIVESSSIDWSRISGRRYLKCVLRHENGTIDH